MAAGNAAMQMLAEAFSSLAKNAKLASNALDLSDQDVINFGKKISSVSFAKIQAGFGALSAKISSIPFGKLGGSFSDIGSKFSKAFSSISSNVKNFAKALNLSDQDIIDFGKKISSLSFNKLLAAFQVSMAKFATIGSAAMTLAAKGITAAAKGVVKGMELVAKNAAPIAKGAFGGLASAAMSPVAGFELLTGSFSSIIGMVERFVSALNPGIIEQMQLAFDDLYAVIGKLFVPIMAAVVPIVRTFADALVPVIQTMIPAFKLFADAMINIATPVIGIFAGLLQELQPYLEQFAGMVAQLASTIGQGLLPIVEAMLPYWNALAEVALMLMEPLNELIKSIMSLAVPIINLIVPPLVSGLKMLASIVTWVVKKFAWLIGEIAGFANDMVGQGGKKLRMQDVSPGASRGTAAKGAQFTGFAEFGQQIMAAAFGGSVNTPEFKTAENTAKMAEGIQTLIRQGENQAPIQVGQAGRGKF